MKQKLVKGVVKTQWGVAFPKALSYSGPVDIYTGYAEVAAANDLPNNDEVVRFKNAQRVANKRQKLVSDVIAAEAEAFAKANPGVVNPYVEPTTENSPKVRWTNIFEALTSHGKSREDAATIATAALDGYTPEDFEIDSE